MSWAIDVYSGWVLITCHPLNPLLCSTCNSFISTDQKYKQDSCSRQDNEA